MASSLAEYLYSKDPPFIAFSLSHILGLVIAILLAIFLPIYAKRNLTERKQQLIGSTLGWLVASAYLSWVLLEIVAGTFDLKSHLPFHLCRTANLMLPFVMMKRNYRVYEILYFWGLSAMFQASFSPDIYAGFPHYHFFRFMLAHNLMIVAIVYATVVYGMRPSTIFLVLFPESFTTSIPILLSNPYFTSVDPMAKDPAINQTASWA